MPSSPPEASKLASSYLVPEIEAPGWLSTTSIPYRLTYSNANAPRAYADSRWVAPPAELLTQKLRQRMAAAGATVLTGDDNARSEYALRVRLEEFGQIFRSANQSHALVKVGATLTRRTGEGRDVPLQRSFTIEQPAASPNAEGGALALAAASDQAITELLNWIVRPTAP